jgi:hypothetical protein
VSWASLPKIGAGEIKKKVGDLSISAAKLLNNTASLDSLYE